MSYELPPLNWLRTFEAAARRGSFTGAARELSLTQPAVSHHIRSLEAYVGFDLFIRHARSVELSDMGSAYLQAVRQALSQLAGATAGLFGLGGERSVTVRCAPSFGTLWLAGRLRGFAEANPGIVVRVFSASWAETSTLERADLEIRYGDGKWSDHDAELLSREPSMPVCSPEVAARLGRDPAVADCAREDLIHIMGCDNFWVRWMKEGGIEDPPPWRGIKVDNSLTALEVAASGYGLALALERFARPYLASGRLTVPIRHFLQGEEALYVVQPNREAPVRPEVQVFRDWLFRENRRDDGAPPLAESRE